MNPFVRFRVEVWCSGECSSRYLQTITTADPSELETLGASLTAAACRDGWTSDRKAIWCPSCTRERHAEDNAATVAQFKAEARKAMLGSVK
jgi:hypothetical protein